MPFTVRGPSAGKVQLKALFSSRTFALPSMTTEPSLCGVTSSASVGDMDVVKSPTISSRDRKSTRLNSSHTVIYTLSLHDALPIYVRTAFNDDRTVALWRNFLCQRRGHGCRKVAHDLLKRSEEHTSELQSHSDLHSFPTRRSSDLRSHCLQ